MHRDLQKDLELCSKATKGPWYIDKVDGPNRLIATTSFYGGGKIYTKGQEASPGADAEFIAEAREGWPGAIKRAMVAEAVNAEVLDILNVLHLVTKQACYRQEENVYDSDALTAYAEAIWILEKYNLLKVVNAAGRRVIAVDIEQAQP